MTSSRRRRKKRTRENKRSENMHNGRQGMRRITVTRKTGYRRKEPAGKVTQPRV